MNDLQAVGPDGILSRLDAARRALAEARTVDEVKELRDQAQAVQHYLKQRDYSFEVQQDAAEIKLRAERRLGELLALAGERRGGNSHGGSSAPLPEGVTHNQSHRWRRIASLPERTFEEFVGEARERRQELTTAGALKLAKRVGNAERLRPAVDATPHAYRRLEALITEGKRFGTIYADPPWQYDNQATRAATVNHYPTMKLTEIAALPVPALTAERSHLHLWTTDCFLEDAIALLKGWGFARRQTLIWCKTQVGIGNYWRSSHEYLLLGIRGGLTFPDKPAVKSYIELPRTEHSVKPAAVRRLIEQVSPGPRLELFGREPADGWTVWGNQAELGMYDEDAVECA
jgi:N6-adenosine-specific RNA methylase IME4